MCFHQSRNKIAAAQVMIIIRKQVDLSSKINDDALVISKQFFYKAMAVVLFPGLTHLSEM
jgi:argininosuccinate lyase